MEEIPRRIAAVLLLVYPHEGEPHVVFTERSATLRNHPGQISLPGGSRDPEDPSLEFTALRETEEEIGISPMGIQILGSLADVDTLGSLFRITPFVGVLSQEPGFRPHPAEVAQIIEVPLKHLCDPSCLGEDFWEVRGGPRKIKFYGYQEHRIWGATAYVVDAFLGSDYPRIAAAALASHLKGTR